MLEFHADLNIPPHVRILSIRLVCEDGIPLRLHRANRRMLFAILFTAI